MIFDSVSRMSRNSREGVELYEQLFNKGVNIIFLKESYINTEVYRQAIENQIKVDFNIEDKATNELITTMIDALNKYTIELLRKQLEEVFAQSQKEVDDLHQRTSEGLLTAKLNGKRVRKTRRRKNNNKKKYTSKRNHIET